MQTLVASALFVLLLCSTSTHAATKADFALATTTPLHTQANAVRDLIARILPKHKDMFVIDVSAAHPDEQFTLTTLTTLTTQTNNTNNNNNKLVISASTGVSAASGFHWFLKYHLNASISWSGDQLYAFEDKPFPTLAQPVTVKASVPVSYYQNVCTVSYSMAWWDWARWEREIDWMAMAGINLPLAFTGQEYVWQRVFAQFNLTEDDLAGFFSGPGFYAWQRMGNIRGWLGPTATTRDISDKFSKDQFELQLKIISRMRDFGMTPVLPAFAGHVPQSLQTHHPTAAIAPSPRWNDFPDKYCCDWLLDAKDPLFVEIGAAFVKEQTALYGDVSHVYNTDTFNEMRPSSSDPAYLKQSAQAVYSSLTKGDPKAVWLMQGWLFQDEEFWGNTQIEALLSGVPDDGMIILDLFSDVSPIFQRCNSYFGKKFVWCNLSNFGGNNNLYGRIPRISTAPVDDLRNTSMVGVGLTMEGINQNWPVYDLMTEMRWHTSHVNTSEWISNYHTRRYGGFSKHADKAWQRLLRTVYNNTVPSHGGTKSMIVLRPSLHLAHEGDMPTNLYYDPSEVVTALIDLAKVPHDLPAPSSLYAYDLVDVTRQVLSNAFYDQHEHLINATSPEDVAEIGKSMLDTIAQMERILSTNTQFTLAPWIVSARAWGDTQEAKDYFEWNARNQITLWGPDGQITDYASKTWGGLVSSYYQPRWQLFVTRLTEAAHEGVPFNQTVFDAEVSVLEQKWQHQHLDSDDIPEPVEKTLDVTWDILKTYFPHYL